jgi:hypothetical protein
MKKTRAGSNPARVLNSIQTQMIFWIPVQARNDNLED